MPKAEDPYYNRKPVPSEFVKDVGYTGLSTQEEYYNRERKYSGQDGVDVRRFGKHNKSGWKPTDDPYYGRKQVKTQETDGVGDTGLTEEQEFASRERKYSVNGVDVRKFSTSATGGLEPLNDPYYGRKQVNNKLTKGIGETGHTPAEEYEVRERKQSVVNFSSDPFQLVSGQGHRQSISGGAVAGAAAAATRRRSSAAAGPDAMHAAHQHHQNTLEPIESRPELPPVGGVGKLEDTTSSSTAGTSTHAATSSTAGASTNGAGPKPTYTYQAFHHDDPDAVAPHEAR